MLTGCRKGMSLEREEEEDTATDDHWDPLQVWYFPQIFGNNLQL